MSGFYSFVYRDCVQLLTDGGFFDDAGNLQRVGEKVIRAHQVPLAITGRGDGATVYGLISQLNDLINLAATCSTADAMLETIRAFMADLSSDGTRFNAEFLIAAIPKQKGRAISLSVSMGATTYRNSSFANSGRKSAVVLRSVFPRLFHRKRRPTLSQHRTFLKSMALRSLRQCDASAALCPAWQPKCTASAVNVT